MIYSPYILLSYGNNNHWKKQLGLVNNLNVHVLSAYLDDNQKADTRTQVRRITIHSSHDIHHSLTNGYYHTKYYEIKTPD